MKQIKLFRKLIFVKVDDEDFDFLNQYTWYLHRGKKTNYARGTVGNTLVYMHKILLPLPDTLTVDHKNGNGLDNQKHNLRNANYFQQNIHIDRQNKHNYRGVSFNENLWRAKIKSNGKIFHLGYFNTAREAALAYNSAAKKLQGEFAILNELDKKKLE